MTTVPPKVPLADAPEASIDIGMAASVRMENDERTGEVKVFVDDELRLRVRLAAAVTFKNYTK